ncbi:Nep2 family protein [Megaselia abdita]
MKMSEMSIVKNPNWWRRRTTLERTLTIISAFAVIAVISLVIGLVAVILSNEVPSEFSTESSNAEALHSPPKISTNDPNAQKSKPTKKDNICFSTECVHTASSVLSAMDKNVEPCDDFYNFACGNFIKSTNIPEDKVSINTFSEIGDKLQLQLKQLVSENRNENEKKPFKLANFLYRACMNKTLIEDRGKKPIESISESLGGWPAVLGDTWDEKSWSWTETVKKFREIGFSMDYILDFSIGVDLKNSTRRIIDLDQSQIGLSREYLVKGLEDKIVKAYYHYMVDMAVLFGAKRSLAETDMLDSINFEIALANISLPSEKRRNNTALYNPYSVKELQGNYSYINWLDYINALLPKELSITENEIVIVSVPSFFEQLGPILEKTPKRTVANYMMWRIHGFSSFFLNEELRKRQLEYSTVLSGREEQEARWKECVDITSGSADSEFDLGLPISVGALYVRKHFNEDAKSIALDMVNGIKNVFENILKEISWMDNETRGSALNKLQKMTTHIGYPDEILNDSKLEEYYKNLDIDPEKYLESVLKMSVFGTNYAFNKLRKPVNKTDWLSHAKPAVVNAYYSALENSIQFPAGILQGKFFAAERPRYMNYGAIGYVIGHEITHGFDDQGRQFDLIGNLVDWWHEDTKEKFLKKSKCIIDQYGNYTDKQTGLNLNGINTQGENIADNGGIKESYIAYNLWASVNGVEQKLPGLDYTPQQMFWISAAQTWCSVYRTETLKMRITTGLHSPAEFRVLGPLSNMDSFAKDFNCPVGSPMNPLHKCEVW